MIPHTALSTAQLPDRLETRWILPAALYGHVRTLIRTHFRLIKYSDRPWVQSIFFNNDSHDLPPEIGIKLRRYFKKPIQGAFRPAHGKWYLDKVVADRERLHQKEKSRAEVDYQATVRHYRRQDALCDFAGADYLCPLNTPLRPYTAIEYRREHFTAKQHEEACRITLDRDIRFWHQLAEGTWVPLGQEYGIRMEIKCLPTILATPLWRALRTLLIRARALPIGGKRYAALNRLSAWQRALIPLPLNELPGVEYGIAFDVPDAHASHALSAELYRMFQRTPHFGIKSDRPWISEGGFIRVYCRDQFRFNLYGDTFRWILIISPPRTSSTTLVRRQRQEKSEHRLITPSQIQELFSAHPFHGALLQGRRQFWVEDRSNRVFQVSVFRSTNFSSHRQLTQVDLQYIGRTVSADPRNPAVKVERQLRALAKLVKSHCEGLMPAHRSLYTFAAMKKTDALNPVAQVLARIGPATARASKRRKNTMP